MNVTELLELLREQYELASTHAGDLRQQLEELTAALTEGEGRLAELATTHAPDSRSAPADSTNCSPAHRRGHRERHAPASDDSSAKASSSSAHTANTRNGPNVLSHGGPTPPAMRACATKRGGDDHHARDAPQPRRRARGARGGHQGPAVEGLLTRDQAAHDRTVLDYAHTSAPHPEAPVHLAVLILTLRAVRAGIGNITGRYRAATANRSRSTARQSQ